MKTVELVRLIFIACKSESFCHARLYEKRNGDDTVERRFHDGQDPDFLVFLLVDNTIALLKKNQCSFLLCVSIKWQPNTMFMGHNI